MYVLYKSKNILTLVTIGYSWIYSWDIFVEYCLWAQVAALDIYCIYWTVWDRYMQVLYLGRAPRTKETLPDFLKWRRVTRLPLVFRGLTGSQRTPSVTPPTWHPKWMSSGGVTLRDCDYLTLSFSEMTPAFICTIYVITKIFLFTYTLYIPP